MVSVQPRPILIFLFTIALGCVTPAPIVHLFPNDADVFWVSGRASVHKEQRGVRVATAFEQQEGNALELRVEIENQTEERLEVEPREFTFTTCVTEAITSCGLTQRIVDPETVLTALAEERSEERAATANNQALLGTLVLLSAVADVATIASGHGDNTTGLTTVEAAEGMEGNAARHDRVQTSIAGQQQYWSNMALRRNTVYPGHGIAGNVFVPFDPKAHRVWLHVRLGTRDFSFGFKQTITPITPARTASTPM